MAECAKLGPDGYWRHLINVDLPLVDGEIWRFLPGVQRLPPLQWDVVTIDSQQYVAKAEDDQIEIRSAPEHHRTHIGRGIWAMKSEEEIAQADAALVAQAYADKVARLTPEIRMRMGIFRTTLRKYFGPNAETNRAITEPVVEAYFIQAIPDVWTLRDCDLLARLFVILREWNGTDETWTLPWGEIPEET